MKRCCRHESFHLHACNAWQAAWPYWEFYLIQVRALVLCGRQQVEGRAEHRAGRRAVALLLHRAQQPGHAGEHRLVWERPAQRNRQQPHSHQRQRQRLQTPTLLQRLKDSARVGHAPAADISAGCGRDVTRTHCDLSDQMRTYFADHKGVRPHFATLRKRLSLISARPQRLEAFISCSAGGVGWGCWG